MSNPNIQIGIDLGTTNSEVAIYNLGKAEIIKNIFGDEYTPSVFGFDKGKNKIVGKRAYEKLFKEISKDAHKNFEAEIKRRMGTSEKVYFENSDQNLTPEQISSEILKSLKEDIIRKHTGFETTAAVITIPAFFSTLQAEATKRAGHLAGFKHVVLLQEPIAAAISYGFMNTNNENWIVYDLGGGTFDVALISSRQGTLTVLAHKGNNFLGGKDFDWLIIDKIIIPNLVSNFRLRDFNKDNPAYKSVFSKLKYIAETTKITLSQLEHSTIEIDGIGNDDNGKEIYSTIPISRKEFENLIRPLVDKTIALTKETVQETGIKQNSINKIILVGAPTNIPYIRNILAKELGVSVDSTVDPLTVVAEGACVYATGQKIPEGINKNTENKTLNAKDITLFFESLSSETEETITGIVKELVNTDAEYYIQIQGDSGYFSGTKVRLRNGKFVAKVSLEKKKANLFWVYLFDCNGNSIPVQPDSISITHGLTVTGAPIPYSIGVAVAKKDFSSGSTLIEVFDPYFVKNSILPLKKSKQYRTVKALKKGDTTNALPIKVYEGESETPDRNILICDLSITGTHLPYDLPTDTDVDITIEVNESRQVKISAYLPIIDLTLNARATIYDEKINIKEMEKDLNLQIERLKAVEELCNEDSKRILKENISSISTSLRATNADEDDKRKARKSLKDLKDNIDNIEKETEYDKLVSDFNSRIKNIDEMIEAFGDNENNANNLIHLNNLKTEGNIAIKNKDKQLLIRIIEQTSELGFKIYLSHPSSWVHQLERLKESSNFTNKQDAHYYIQKGDTAIKNNDFEELKRCVQKLFQLLPPDERNGISSNISGITY